MKTTKILFWVFNGLFAFMMFGSAIPDVLMQKEAVEGMSVNLGYPLYFVPFIGVAKILGVIAILIPGYPRIKEWAYAGLMFDLFGATYSIFSIPVEKVQGSPYFMFIPLTVGVLAYVWYRKKIAGTPASELK